jgi:hypothetical protein
LLESLLDEAGKFGFIFDDQDIHRYLLPVIIF